MKKEFILLIVLLSLLPAFGQQKKTLTVEEIIERYKTVIGGSEKMNKVVSKKEVRSTFREYEVTGQSAEKKSYIEEDIGFVDCTGRNIAYITRYITTKGDTLWSKQLTSNGKTTAILPNGEKKIKKSTVNKFEEGCFKEIIIAPGSEVLPNEIFKGEEVYVIHSNKTISNNNWDEYIYFDVNSGLMIGSKLVGTNKILGTSYLSISEYTEYKEVEGILVSHKILQYIKSVSSQAISTRIENKTIELIKLEFNTDIKDFKQNCFQKPEECFAAYERNK